MRIDLHTHSSASDGTEPPERVMQQAAAAGLDVVALTDHDTAVGWQAAGEAAVRLGLTFVPGTEVSCQHQGISVHLLSYLHDPDSPELSRALEEARTSRLHRARRMVDLIGTDYDITWDDVSAQVAGTATIGRPHIADALVAKGYAPDRDTVFATVLGTDSPYFIGHYAPDALEAIRMVRHAGGVPVFAHPMASRRGTTVSPEVFEAMIEAGLAGLEVDHRDHDEEQKVWLRDVATSHRLFVTGSSDYHGTGKQNAIGEHLTAPEVVSAIEEQGTGSEVARP